MKDNNPFARRRPFDGLSLLRARRLDGRPLDGRRLDPVRLTIGAASLAASLAAAPLLLACACPPGPMMEYAVPIGPVAGDEFPSCSESCDGVTDVCRYAELNDGSLAERVRSTDRTQPMEEPAEYVAICYVERPVMCGVGRNPAALSGVPLWAKGTSLHPCGAHFARMAELEGRAVLAFVELAAELRVHGAPMELVRWAERAAMEEVQHTRRAAEMATYFGGVGLADGAEAIVEPPRSLEAVLRTNRLEGGVEETFGAKAATHQGTRAHHPAVRALMAGVGADETGHAALSLAVHRWGRSRLSPVARRQLDDDTFAALDRLSSRMEGEPGPVGKALGQPSATRAQEDIAALRLHAEESTRYFV